MWNQSISIVWESAFKSQMVYGNSMGLLRHEIFRGTFATAHLYYMTLEIFW